LVCIADVAFFGAFAVFVLLASQNPGVASARSDPWLRLIQIVGWIGALGAGVALYSGFRSWTEARRSLWSRIGNTLIAIACLGVVWFALEWGLLLGSLRY
jgi:uncharacterized membrane protein YhiD involved in acid resistance